MYYNPNQMMSPWASPMMGGGSYWTPQRMQQAQPMPNGGENRTGMDADPNATGADRPGMGYRKARRQAQRAGTYDPNAQMGGVADQMQGAMPPFSMPWGSGGGGPWGGGFSGFAQMFPQMQQMGGAQPEPARMSGFGQGMQPQQQQQSAQVNGQAGFGQPVMQAGMASFFDSPYGRLTTASGGNNNLYKREGGGEDELFAFDPSRGWGGMTPGQYQSSSGNFADPQQYAQQAGMAQQQFYRLGEDPNLKYRGGRWA